MMPASDEKVDCPNCGRTRVRLEKYKPNAALSNPKQDPAKVSSIFWNSVVKRSGISFLIFYPIVAMSIASWVPEDAFAFIAITVSLSLSALYFTVKLRRHNRIYRTPQRGYIYHLGILNHSARRLEDEIAKLRRLAEDQNSDSERSVNRLRVVNDAIANRELRLHLILETCFIIKAKRRMSRISALARDMSDRVNLVESEKNLRFFILEIQNWLNERPTDYRSVAGRRMYQSLIESSELFREMLEQLEDRRVMRAIDGGTVNAPSEGLALKQIEQFLDDALVQPEYDLFEVEEVVATDEEYLKINTELRLIKDGIRPGCDEDLLTVV